MADEAQVERPMAEKHPFTNEDGEEFIAYSFRGGSVTLDWRDEDGKFVEVPLDFRPSALADELLRVVAERDEALARPVEILIRRAHLHVHLDQLALADLLIDIAKEISPAHTEAAISAMEEGARRGATDAN